MIDFFLQLGLASHWLEQFANSTPTAEKNDHHTEAPHTLSETLAESQPIFIIGILFFTCGNFLLTKISYSTNIIKPTGVCINWKKYVYFKVNRISPQKNQSPGAFPIESYCITIFFVKYRNSVRLPFNPVNHEYVLPPKDFRAAANFIAFFLPDAIDFLLGISFPRGYLQNTPIYYYTSYTQFYTQYSAFTWHLCTKADIFTHIYATFLRHFEYRNDFKHV